MVLAFAEAGADVVIASRKQDACDELAARGRAHDRAAGVRRCLPRRALGRTWSASSTRRTTSSAQVDVLVNNAGMSPLYPSLRRGHRGPLRQGDRRQPQGPVPARGADRRRAWRRATAGRSSTSAASPPSVPPPTSCPTPRPRRALDILTVGFAQAYGPKVRVNTIMAGTVPHRHLQGVGPRRVRAASRRPTRSGAAAQPHEIVGAALYLASDASSFTTGTGAPRRRRPGSCVAMTTSPDLAGYREEAGRGSAATSTRAKPAASSGRAVGRRRARRLGLPRPSATRRSARLLERADGWQQTKFDAGYGAISWPESFGGTGLPAAYEQAFVDEEAAFATPRPHETFAVTVRLIAPDDAPLRRRSSNGRGSSAAFGAPTNCAASCSRSPAPARTWPASPPGPSATGTSGWSTAQKVWSSGARFAPWGELIARTDPDVPKHAGMTAFLVPMDTPGVEVRPIRQMSGGSSFNEVFFTDVRIPDGCASATSAPGGRSR